MFLYIVEMGVGSSATTPTEEQLYNVSELLSSWW